MGLIRKLKHNKTKKQLQSCRWRSVKKFEKFSKSQNLFSLFFTKEFAKHQQAVTTLDKRFDNISRAY